MGGKGGGGGGSAQSMEAQGYVLDPSKFGPADNPASAGYVTKADYDAKYPKAAPAAAAPDTSAADKAAADKAAADKAASDKAAADKAAADAAAVAAAPKATTNLDVPNTPSLTGDPAAPAAPVAPVAALGAPVAPGTPLGTPAPATETGDLLGGAVLKPPKYWVGGLDAQTSESQTGRTGGSIRTTQS